MYVLGMSTVNIPDARARLPELLNVAESEPVFIERRGQRAAVLVSPERYEQMLDALAYKSRTSQHSMQQWPRKGIIFPRAQVKADLGWA